MRDKWQASAWLAMLDRCRLCATKPAWVLVPDVVGDRDATLLDVLQLDVFGDKLKQAFYDLDGPPVRITTPHVPLPAADVLEDMILPTIDRIAEKVRRSLES